MHPSESVSAFLQSYNYIYLDVYHISIKLYEKGPILISCQTRWFLLFTVSHLYQSSILKPVLGQNKDKCKKLKKFILATLIMLLVGVTGDYSSKVKVVEGSFCLQAEPPPPPYPPHPPPTAPPPPTGSGCAWQLPIFSSAKCNQPLHCSTTLWYWSYSSLHWLGLGIFEEEKTTAPQFDTAVSTGMIKRCPFVWHWIRFHKEAPIL